MSSVDEHDADAGAGAWAAVLAGLPRRARTRGRDSEGGFGLRGRIEAASVAAAVPAAFRQAGDSHRQQIAFHKRQGGSPLDPPATSGERHVDEEIRTAVDHHRDSWQPAVTGVQGQAQATPFRFKLQDATIADVHRAIEEGQITCQGLVQAYSNRARAYNGTCNELVTETERPQLLARLRRIQGGRGGDGIAAAGRSEKDAADRVRAGSSRPPPIPRSRSNTA